MSTILDLAEKIRNNTATTSEILLYLELTKNMSLTPRRESSFVEDVASTALGVAAGNILGSALGGMFGGFDDSSSSSSSDDWSGGGGDFSGGGSSGDW